MSEQINIKNENLEDNEQLAKASSEHQSATHKHEEKPIRHEHKDKIDTILEKIEYSSKTASEIAKKQNTETEKDDTHQFVGSELKAHSLNQSLRQVQRSLKPYQRPFSKFIHNNAAEKMSEAVGNTVARPSGLLVGGICSFLASLLLLVVSKYYGYEYNYLIGLTSLVVGFFIGIFGEFMVKLFRRS